MVDVIIPLYKPGKELFALIESLSEQTVKPGKVILINTEEKYFEQLVYGTSFLQKYKDFVTVTHIGKREFDHGKTRHRAVQKSNAEVFLMMTQDALPADTHLIENLLQALTDEKTAVAYARQLPNKDCSITERYTRNFNYSNQSLKKTRDDIEKLGIKTYFCSNVCAAYKRDIYDKLGGFIQHTIFNEDMIYAANAIKKGYAIAYEASALVYHSHNYTASQQFHRNFDIGVSQADHPEIFKDVPSVKEGKRMVMDTVKYLNNKGRKHLIIGYLNQSFCKYLGYQMGKHYRMLPYFIILRCTLSPTYWKMVNSDR